MATGGSAQPSTAGDPRLASALPWVARLPTGTKLFLILSLCLAPLAMIAIAATLQTTRLSDAETRARLRLTSAESARAIAIEVSGEMRALQLAAQALHVDPRDLASCARVQGVFAQAVGGGRFSITDRTGQVICGASLGIAGTVPGGKGDIRAVLVGDQGVLLALAPAPTRLNAQAFFPTARLSALVRPSGPASTFESTLQLRGDEIRLLRGPEAGSLGRFETIRTEVGIAQLTLLTRIRSAPISSSLIVALLLPLLMWVAAAGISWLVVDRLLIRPLRRLRASAAAFTPGQVIEVGADGPLPAAEIRELGDTFRAISRTVAIHEAGLAEGLVRQTKLTREVHHRVKNNLQVISSLISFHARGAPSADATAAYSSIQRRVDALAVVHRNHFAENEENRGLNLRTMIGELAANLRASAPEGASGLGITLEVESLMVNQDIAVAVAFLITETVELAMNCDPSAQVRIAVRTAADEADRATLRVVSRALIESETLSELVRTRYARVMQGLSRQLRAPLHHDPLAGIYEIGFGTVGRA
ncbi:MAG: histidine kinase [Sphingomonas bacterium]|uniref:sensor histidine kinase n=1 Tax=Sphingomonas bacterium TaxID=1895847 RepID=UPI0026234513|nr:histidine kinase dimerization/phosphoacceptor domain -containing protein [Sphingomonas bacterium]MDB5696736.1 histidine kinase [Sphingomonas bacterium]